jgi:purine-binding chemotaxis protein CheW
MNRQIGQSTTILYVVLTLASEYYGIDIRDTYRVLRMDSLIKVADAPPVLKGAVNLLGKLVPVVDLRKRLGLQVTRPTSESRIVVVNIAEREIGLITDSVIGVLPILRSSIEPVNAATAYANYLWGIANLGPRQVLLLDLDKVFSVFNGRIPAVPAISGTPPARPGEAQSVSNTGEEGQLTLRL